MKYDLYNVRTNMYQYTQEEFANLMEIALSTYLRFEKEGEIPSKYIYKIWTKIPGFPIPEDFFCFTSGTLLVNMKFHHLTQNDIKKLFGIENQSSVSMYLAKNYPMYEMKEKFLQFDPFIVPLEMKYDEEGNMKYFPITKLIPRLIFSEDYRSKAKLRGKRAGDSKKKQKQDNQEAETEAETDE